MPKTEWFTRNKKEWIFLIATPSQIASDSKVPNRCTTHFCAVILINSIRYALRIEDFVWLIEQMTRNMVSRCRCLCHSLQYEIIVAQTLNRNLRKKQNEKRNRSTGGIGLCKVHTGNLNDGKNSGLLSIFIDSLIIPDAEELGKQSPTTLSMRKRNQNTVILIEITIRISPLLLWLSFVWFLLWKSVLKFALHCHHLLTMIITLLRRSKLMCLALAHTIQIVYSRNILFIAM